MSGELFGLSAALFWAITVLASRQVTGRASLLVIAAMRSLVWGICSWIVFVLSGLLPSVSQIPLRELVILLAAATIGMAIGDTIFLRAQYLIGITRALPISSSYPALTAILAFIIAGELLTPANYLGIVLVTSGSYITAVPRAAQPGIAPEEWKSVNLAGVAISFAASMCWALSSVLLLQVVEVVPPLTTNAVRLPYMALILWIAVFAARTRNVNASAEIRKLTWRDLLFITLAGSAAALSSIFFLNSLSIVGVSKATTLTSTVPFFALPLAAFFFKERLTQRTVLGTLIVVVGVWLVIL